MYGLSAALGKAGAAVGTQVFKPILAALEDRTSDVLKAQGYIFIIGPCISILGGILIVLFVVYILLHVTFLLTSRENN